MIPIELREDIDRYIAENFIEEIIVEPDYITNIAKEKGLDDSVPKKEVFSLEDILNEVGESFHEMLFMRIDMSGMTDVEIYKRANIDRKLFSKIRSNPAYHPRKQTVLALAIALKLNLEDTVDLLSRAEYAFSPGNKGDLIVKYFIEQGIYDIMAINFALDEYNLPILE